MIPLVILLPFCTKAAHSCVLVFSRKAMCILFVQMCFRNPQASALERAYCSSCLADGSYLSRSLKCFTKFLHTLTYPYGRLVLVLLGFGNVHMTYSLDMEMGSGIVRNNRRCVCGGVQGCLFHETSARTLGGESSFSVETIEINYVVKY